MFAKFDEIPAITLQVIKETKRYGRTDARKTEYPHKHNLRGYQKCIRLPEHV